MHKSFKLNPDYSASLSKEVLFKGVPVENNGGMVEIVIGGCKYLYDAHWFLEVDKTTFFSYLEKNIPLKNWRIEEIQEHSPLGAKSSSVLL